MGRRENVVVCGPSGTGKTFFLEALGQEVVEAGMRVAWFRLEDLGALVRAHRADDSITRVVARILRADLVVIDDIGLLPVGTDAAEGLYRLVDAAYEKRSIAISSNLASASHDCLGVSSIRMTCFAWPELVVGGLSDGRLAFGRGSKVKYSFANRRRHSGAVYDGPSKLNTRFELGPGDRANRLGRIKGAMP